MTLLLTLGLGIVGLTVVCSIFEATLYCTRLGFLQAERDGKKHARAAGRFIEMKKNIAVPTSAILILATISHTAGATIFGVLVADQYGANWVVSLSIALTMAILFFGEIFPKTYGAAHWRGIWHWIV